MQIYSMSKTGYTYFGARYYSSDISVWLSVDPMASKYPNVSPYMYVLGNPVRNIDPDGRWVKGAGFWRNVFKSDSRINAENRVTALKKQGIDATKKRNREAGGWDVFYESSETVDFGDGNKTFNIFAVENFSKKNRNNEVGEAVSYIDRAMDNGIRNLTKPLGKINTGVGSTPYRVAQAVANINPLVSIPNAVKTLTMGENIYDEKTDKVDAVFSVIDVATLGADGIVLQATNKIFKPLIPVSKVGVELINANKNVLKIGNATLQTTKTLTGK